MSPADQKSWMLRFRSVAALTAILVLSLVSAHAATPRRTDFFVLWGSSGRWVGQLTISNGRFARVTPYLFTDNGDKIQSSGAQQVSWRSETNGDVDGLQVTADASANGAVRFASDRTTQTFSLRDLPERGFKVVPVDEQRRDYLIIGRGSPEKGPRAKHEIPNLGLSTIPARKDIVELPDNTTSGSRIRIDLQQRTPGALAVRRRSRNDGILYLEVYSKSGPLSGPAIIAFGESKHDTSAMGGSLWIALRPFIGTLSMDIAGAGTASAQHLTVPASLVETRGPRLFLNGEPFLIKGTLPRGLNDKDAHYLKTLGVNTLRGLNMEAADRYGFMLVASMNSGLGKIVTLHDSPTDEAFQQNVTEYVKAISGRAADAARSPHTLAIQLSNEQTDGNDPWSDSQKSVSAFDRLDQLLTKAYETIKPMDPMLPLGYANHARGYIAPDFLDVYMHNSYMGKDRYGVPLATYMQWQGCDKRPFINTEFGANRYNPQAYHGARNSPVLEKIHAWNFPHRWKEYVDAGTAGAINYCTYDLDAPRDQGNSNFGLLTFAREPKLACWEVAHMWRDFEVTPGKSLTVSYKRDYWARDCKLTLTSASTSRTIDLGDFAPHSSRTVQAPVSADSFRWEISYTTHRGLPMLATGAYPRAVEEKDFLQPLKARDTYSFLSQLLDAEVVTAQGKVAPPTLTEMQRPDGVVPVAFRKPNGTVYITAFARLPVRGQGYVKADIQTTFKGKVAPVDEWTGETTGTAIESENRSEGILLHNINVPRIPGPIGQRSEKPLSLPVFRITPE